MHSVRNHEAHTCRPDFNGMDRVGGDQKHGSCDGPWASGRIFLYRFATHKWDG